MGRFFCLPDNEADRFVTEFFPGLSAKEARLGNDELGLSPKILIVLPGQRLSWQYHHRRAERWRFLSEGGYYQSEDDEMGEIVKAGTGEIVQFQCGGRHRLCGADSSYTLVAEIWQHTDMNQPSDEADIVRVADDYGR